MSTAPKQTPGFERVEGITRSTYVLLPYGKYLLAGASDGVFAVAGMQATKILDTKGPVWDLSPSRSDPSIVYAASGDGLFVLRHTSASWEKSGEHMMAGQEFRTIVEDLPGRVWATTKNLVWRVDFRQNPPIAEKFSAGASESWLSVFRIQGRNVFATQSGLKTFSAKDRRLVPDMTFGAWLADGSHDVTNIFQEPGGNIWITGKGYHGLLRKAGASYQWEPMPLLRSHIDEVYGLLADPNHIAWAFGPDYVLYRWDSSLAGDPNRDFHPLTRRISVVGSKAVWYGGAGEVPAMRLPYRNNALRFEFAAPFYEDAASVEYQYQLEGSDGEWSAWTHESRKDYTHLPEGDYRFHVRARNPHGRISEESISSFGVLAPWYRTWLAYAVYVIFAGFGVWGIVRFRVRQLEEDKRQLEATVAERTVEIRRQRDEIQVQERKSHSLLLNILPAQVADELKTTGAVKPVGFDDVTVCFTDFVGFTLSSEKLPPRDLVDRLNEYFTAFDEIVARYGLEKLKTIGDSYMFVSGLPAPRASHAVDAVLAALEMVEVVKRLAAKSEGTGWNIRVGLHSGPVVAGVVGTRKFAFDIWGNTVNFAARMESSGVPGRVNLSERTCRLTRELIECEGRGQVRIKE
ncbi:MAG TPA: adenylate/guanylate cyclase domain-containing protein, partial [Bryobacteraceae bacterium]|nr:adenylate/guanylate cyclase domain-containing protein [Bryobacteraceae bacterium]